MRRGTTALIGVASLAFACAAACGSFATDPAPSPVADSGPDVAEAAVTERVIDAGADVVDAAAPREAGPLWDGGCVQTKVSICDPLEDIALDQRFDALAKAPASNGLKVETDPSWPPTTTTANKALHASILSSAGVQWAYVARDLPFGYRFGVAFRFGIFAHPLAAVPGPRLVAGDGPEGTVPALGLLFSNRIGLQQIGPALKEVTDLGDLGKSFWHKIVIEVRREPSPSGLGWIYTTLDGAAPVRTPLATSFTSGQLRFGIPYSDGTQIHAWFDDLAFFEDP